MRRDRPGGLYDTRPAPDHHDRDVAMTDDDSTTHAPSPSSPPRTKSLKPCRKGFEIPSPAARLAPTFPFPKVSGTEAIRTESRARGTHHADICRPGILLHPHPSCSCRSSTSQESLAKLPASGWPRHVHHGSTRAAPSPRTAGCRTAQGDRQADQGASAGDQQSSQAMGVDQ
jgi:hypothetical protein